MESVAFSSLKLMFEFEKIVGKSLRNNQNPTVIFLNLLLAFFFLISLGTELM